MTATTDRCRLHPDRRAFIVKLKTKTRMCVVCWLAERALKAERT